MLLFGWIEYNTGKGKKTIINIWVFSQSAFQLVQKTKFQIQYFMHSHLIFVVVALLILNTYFCAAVRNHFSIFIFCVFVFFFSSNRCVFVFCVYICIYRELKIASQFGMAYTRFASWIDHAFDGRRRAVNACYKFWINKCVGILWFDVEQFPLRREQAGARPSRRCRGFSLLCMKAAVYMEWRDAHVRLAVNANACLMQ